MSESNPVGRPLLFKTVEELDLLIEKYFSVEGDAYIPMGDARMYAPTMSGLALSIGVDRKTLLNYAQKDEFFLSLKKAKSRVEIALEQRLYGNNVTGIIFNLKNNFDWADKNEIAHTSPDGSMSPRGKNLDDFYGETDVPTKS